MTAWRNERIMIPNFYAIDTIRSIQIKHHYSRAALDAQLRNSKTLSNIATNYSMLVLSCATAHNRHGGLLRVFQNDCLHVAT